MRSRPLRPTPSAPSDKEAAAGSVPSGAALSALHASARGWFEASRRSLPWRTGRTPYRVWVSEIMLQQTQVATVIPYFERFMERFPDLEALARADQEAVLSLWRGLGYYSRARNLHRGALYVLQHHQGRFPETLTEALDVPGVGRYTAGAILSLAFRKPVALLDGNVARVLARLIGSTENPKTPSGMKYFWSLAEQLLDHSYPDEWNEALMELGATVCMPARAACAGCPLRSECRAAQMPDPTVLPTRLEKAPRPETEALGLVLRTASGELLLARRPDEGLLGGMWELPGGHWTPALGLEDEARRLARTRLNLPLDALGARVTLSHVFTHFRLTLTVVEATVEESRLRRCVEREAALTQDSAPRRAGTAAIEADWTGLALFERADLQTLPMGRATLKALTELGMLALAGSTLSPQLTLPLARTKRG